MKVICINDAGTKELKFGAEYTVVDGRNCYVSGLYCYFFEEVVLGYEAQRFAPVSEIDETEFERNYNKELV